MRISDWSSDVCSSDLIITSMGFDTRHINNSPNSIMGRFMGLFTRHPASVGESYFQHMASSFSFAAAMLRGALAALVHGIFPFFFRSEEHTSELQSLMRNSYAVFCLTKKKNYIYT